MTKTHRGDPASCEVFLEAVREQLSAAFPATDLPLDIGRGEWDRLHGFLRPGKMLRARLVWALRPDISATRPDLVRAAAATELVHAATLFHDDVIDGGTMRRSRPSLWREIGTTGAILVGDLCVTGALALLAEAGDPRQTVAFVRRLRELCQVEVLHELVFRRTPIEPTLAVRIARGKTGPLFAFVAECCGGDDKGCCAALAEAGYRLGTAYQLADDLLDEWGDEAAIGKTLGTDRERQKPTLAQDHGLSVEELRGEITTQCDSAVQLLEPWPELAGRLRTYIEQELLKLWHAHTDLAACDD